MSNSQTNSYLEQDPPIPNQSYSLFSFVPPKESVEKMFNVSRYERIKETLEKQKEEIMAKIKENPDYLVPHILTSITPALVDAEKEEATKSHSLRGAVKFRGTFTTVEEAKKYSEYLRNLDPNYDIFLGQTGFWYPFNPSRENVKEQNYYGKELNELMKGYMENKTKADIHFKQRMREMTADKIKKDLEEKAKLEDNSSEEQSDQNEEKPAAEKDEDIIDEL